MQLHYDQRQRLREIESRLDAGETCGAFLNAAADDLASALRTLADHRIQAVEDAGLVARIVEKHGRTVTRAIHAASRRPGSDVA